MTKKDFVKSERKFTIELLKGLTNKQWSEPTLCKGWNVVDLAAHLVSRERSAIGGVGIVMESLKTLHSKRIAKVKAKGHKYIISKLENYPWWMPASFNTAEFYIHNEDLLRGGLNKSRPLPNSEASQILWNSLKGLLKFQKNTLKDLGSVQLEDTQTDNVITIPNKHSLKDTVITGPPGELLLFVYGRRDAAKVTISKAKL